MNWFTNVVAHHPYVVLMAVGVFSSACMIVSIANSSLPNFTDPQRGFESRGTIVAQRLTAWENLIEETKPSGMLTLNPSAAPPLSIFTAPLPKDSSKSTIMESKKPDGGSPLNEIDNTHNMVYGNSTLVDWSAEKFNESINSNRIISNHVDWEPVIELDYNKNDSESSSDSEKEELWPLFKNENNNKHSFHFHNHLSEDGFFCGQPDPLHARLVLKSTDGSDLFSLDAMLEMCQLTGDLVANELFADVCETVTHDRHHCCLPWSLSNYIALLNNRTSCHNITNEDLNKTRTLLEECANFYYDLQLVPDLRNIEVPLYCRKYNAVYNIIHFLVDTDFLPPHNGSRTLKYTTIFLPMACSTATLDYYHSLESKTLATKHTVVSGIEFGLKNVVFDEDLVRDSWLVLLGAGFVLASIWLYTNSLFITITTTMAISFSLGVSYFIYTLIFKLSFFPFMNLLASIVAVGIGADDAFILCKVWQCSKIDNSSITLQRLVYLAMRHCTLSMLVTTITTAAAFYASYISKITAIRCFSVFAGTAVMVNFVLMVTWLPACVVIAERVCWPALVTLPAFMQSTYAAWNNLSLTLNSLLVSSVLRLRYVWIVFCGSVAVGSVIIVFYWPKLKLPDSADFQLFTSNHPFEQYDMVYRKKFWFERLQRGEDNGDWENPNAKLPLRFVWGVQPVDNGDYLDPSSRGKLKLDKQFDVADPESQIWLLQFCRHLRAQPFYQSTSGPLLPNCFIESLIDWMNRKCTDPVDRISRAPCCESQTFPFTRRVFNQCVMKAIDSLYRTPAELFMPGVAGPKFSRSKTPRIKALVVEYDSNFAHSTSFDEMDKFYKQVESWTEEEMSRAPAGMRNGWFVSQLSFYDLQRTLAEDTVSAITVAMVVSLVVLVLITLNLLVSLLTIITITSIIFVTVAVLVLLGWKLNVLESISVCVAIGLAVDFSLHYAVNYRMCPDQKREPAVTYALTLMAGPTAMAALTTIAAGALMLPSAVLAYNQIGLFLVIVMLVSWLYSTYFLMPLLSVFGPEAGYGQFSYPKLWGNKRRGPRPRGGGLDRSNKTIYTNVLSESTLSSSSTMCALHMLTNETHELDAFTRQTRLRSGSGSGSASGSKRIRRSGSFCQSSAHPQRTPRKVSLPADQSPSAVSATTIIHDDDCEIMVLPGSHAS
ncbi:hypothetical protein LSTR_LSTR002479 [Laodelphax striatellus]|uniref:SSD domain-containing protein n=1 Tax=Laodelphax striatellus TaxID=195883 RepID=A0A482X387_LAOST|nr:hypothetical protein LSTR_LSTR002479 [Laodelphax striatellus]